MIKKYLASAILVFMIIFAGSQSNVAEAEQIYMGYYEAWDGNILIRKGQAYLMSNSVRGNPNMIQCDLVFLENENDSPIFPLTLTFKKGLKRWFVHKKCSGYRPSTWNELTNFESNLLNYILNNYE